MSDQGAGTGPQTRGLSTLRGGWERELNLRISEVGRSGPAPTALPRPAPPHPRRRGSRPRSKHEDGAAVHCGSLAGRTSAAAEYQARVSPELVRRSCPRLAQDPGLRGRTGAGVPFAPPGHICLASAIVVPADRPGAAEGRPPGPGPAQPLPRSPGPPLGPLPLLSLWLRRPGRPGLGLRLPHPADAVLLARGPIHRRTGAG